MNCLLRLGLILSIGVSASLPSLAEQSIQSDSFVDSAGVNIHLHYTDTLYYSNFPLIESSLKALGIRHVRDGVEDTTLQAFYDRLNQLGADGIHGIFITVPTQTPALLQAWPSRVATSFEGFEGPNEYDASGDVNWAATLHAFLPVLASAAKSAGFPVVAPSFTNMTSYSLFGSAGAAITFGNMHNYPGQRNPGTAGWWGAGYQNYGSTQLGIQLEQTVSGTDPIFTTETGYDNDQAIAYPIPESVSAVYMPRVFLNQWLSGVKRTYLYELLSEHSTGEDFGLLRYDGSAKPAFGAVANLLNLLADPGPSFTPAALDYTITGGDSTLQHLLLQKRDGSFYLVLWLETYNYDVNLRAPITVAAQPLTVHVAHPLLSATAYQFDQTGQAAPTALPVGEDLTLSASPAVLIVKLQLSGTNHLSVQANPPLGGTISYSPSSNDGYYDPSKTVTVTAAAAPGYQFTGFTGDITSQASPLSVLMSSTRNLVANFDCAYSTTGSVGAPSTLSVPITGGTTTVPVTTGPNCNWSPASAASWVTVPAITAKGNGNLAIGYSANTGPSRTTQVVIGSVAISVSQATQKLVPIALTLTTNYGVMDQNGVMKSNVLTRSAAGVISVDGTLVKTPATLNWYVGSVHTLAAVQPQFILSQAYLGFSWAPGVTGLTTTITTPGAATAYGENLMQSALLSTTATAGGNIAVTPNPAATAGYYILGQQVLITATPNAGCTFVGFSGTTTSKLSPLTLYMTRAQTVAATFSCPASSSKH